MSKESTDATRMRLSQAVWETVANDGIEATTVRRVAQRAECTTGLLMHQFGSRTAMLTHAREVLYKRTAASADNAERLGINPGTPCLRCFREHCPWIQKGNRKHVCGGLRRRCAA